MGSTYNDNHEFNDYEIIFRQFKSGISLMWNTMIIARTFSEPCRKLLAVNQSWNDNQHSWSRKWVAANQLVNSKLTGLRKLWWKTGYKCLVLIEHYCQVMEDNARHLTWKIQCKIWRITQAIWFKFRWHIIDFLLCFRRFPSNNLLFSVSKVRNL